MAPRGRRIIIRGRFWSLFFWGCVFVIASNACGSATPTGQRPKPALSSDSRAQLRFRELSDKWHAASPEQRLQLEQPLRQFLLEFPYDDVRRLSWVYLSWILVQKGELLEARELVDKVKNGPPGSANDLATVTEAALLLQLNQPQEALRLLRPVRGKLIDPVERFLLTEQLVAAAIGSNLHSEALLYMVDWGVQAPVTQRKVVREAIESRLHHTPRRYLERALVEFETSEGESERDPLRQEEQEWLKNAITRRLKALAVEEHDVELAKLVLEHNPSLGGDRDAAEELMQLAAANRSLVQIKGRTIGLVLTTGTAAQRLRSNQIVSAASVALGLPHSATEAGAVRLVFAEDAGGKGDAERSFASLSEQGAAILVGGVDLVSAIAHAREAERGRIPTLLLHPHDLRDPEYSHTIGVSLSEQERALEDEMRARGALSTASVSSGHELCSQGSNASVKTWLGHEERAGTRGVLLLGGPRCAAQILASAGRSTLLFGLGLEETVTPSAEKTHVVRLGAGRFPFAEDDPAIGSWVARQRSAPSWYQTLGRDAVTIARSVLSALPEVTLSEAEEVIEYKNQVRARLRRLRDVELWSTDDARFDDGLTLERRFRFEGQGR